jgi:MoxR-like ATPase
MDNHRENLDKAKLFCKNLHKELGKVIVGFRDELDHIDIALLTGGHVLFEGVPGLAKTLLVRSLAEALGLKFKRIQFTPDLMPSDVTGSTIYKENTQTFEFIEGPIFANIVLADEINRTPPKTQSALLEAMQESAVTVGHTTHKVPSPFFVFATQNPIEQEGTYPLPEAQLDRFLFKVNLKYPSLEDEKKIAKIKASAVQEKIQPVSGIESLLDFQLAVKHVLCADELIDYAVRLVSATRPGSECASERNTKYIEWGAGPRASRWIISAAQARAVLLDRYHVDLGDIQFVAKSILRHRILLNYHAISDKKNVDGIIQEIIDSVSL